jgi:hypothetical protein
LLSGYSVWGYGADGKVIENRTVTGVEDDVSYFRFGRHHRDPTPLIWGAALVDPNGAVIDFISFGSSFKARNGPAKGFTAKDVNVRESYNDNHYESAQKCDDNSGRWISAKKTLGEPNEVCPTDNPSSKPSQRPSKQPECKRPRQTCKETSECCSPRVCRRRRRAGVFFGKRKLCLPRV